MTSLETVVLHPYKQQPGCPPTGCYVHPCATCGLLRFEHPTVPTCHVDMWTSNLRTLIEVYCSQHGLLGQVPFSDAVTLRDEHLSTGGAPVVTGPDASPDTTSARVRVYPYQCFGGCCRPFLAFGVACEAVDCEWLSDDWGEPGKAADDGRRHLREVHR